MSMSPAELRSRLEGVIAFPVTPFTAQLELDLPALRDNVEFMLAGGIHALVAAGGTGELYSLTPEEHRQVVRTVVEVVHGRVPVIAGTGFGSALGRLLARQAEEAGADGILMLPPYYVNAYPEGLLEYYRHVAGATSLGVFPYSRDWVVFTPATLRKLTEIPNVIAYKDGQGDLRAFSRLQHAVGDRLLWLGGVGDDMVGGYFAAGAKGFTSSVANYMPKVAVELFELAKAGDFMRLREVTAQKIQGFYDLRISRRGYEVSMVKEAMELLGHKAGPVRPPLVNVTAQDRERLRAALDHAGLRPVAKIHR
jgi:5-dehydro-4-deoxyglucarate dehydratase